MKMIYKKVFNYFFKILILIFIYSSLISCSLTFSSNKSSDSKLIKEKDLIEKKFNDYIKDDPDLALELFLINPDLQTSSNKKVLIESLRKKYEYFKKFILEGNYGAYISLYKYYRNLEYLNIDLSEDLNFITKKVITLIDNYYILLSFERFLLRYKPVIYKELKELLNKKFNSFSNSLFVSNFHELSNQLVTVFNDKGMKFSKGYYVPDLSLGTGFFITPNMIITNYHVVKSDKSYSKLYIELNGKKIEAKLIFYSDKFDLAIIKINYFNKKFKYLRVKESINIGDEVIACGSPVGLENTFTKGIISNTKRKLLFFTEVYQTDVALNAGNSGGPVVSSNFELVGIAFAGLPQFQNINFVIPANVFLDIVFYSKKEKKLTGSWLGFYSDKDINLRFVFPDTITYELFKNYGFDEKFLNGKGLKTYRIHAIDNKKFSDLYELQRYIFLLPSFTVIKIKIEKKVYTLFTTTRLKAPFKELIRISPKSQLYIPIVGVVVEKTKNNNFKIKEILNNDLNFTTGVEIGDEITIVSTSIDEKNSLIKIVLKIKYFSKGGIERYIVILRGFDSPNII